MIRIGYNKNDKKHPIWCYNISKLFSIPNDTFVSTRLEMGEITFEQEDVPDLDLTAEEVHMGRVRNHVWFDIHISDREWRNEHSPTPGYRYLCFAFDLTDEILYYPNFIATYTTGRSECVKFMEHSIENFGCQKEGMETFECAFFYPRERRKVISIIM